MGLLWGLNAIPFEVLSTGRDSKQSALTSLSALPLRPTPLPKVPQLPAGSFPRGQLHSSPPGPDHRRQPGLLLINGMNFLAALTSQRGSSATLIREGLPRSPVRQPQASCKIHHNDPNKTAGVCLHLKIWITHLLMQAAWETGWYF